MPLVASAPPYGEALPASCGKGRKHAGAFIEHPQLAQLSAMLRAVDTGDRVIKGRLELFACTRRRLTPNQQSDLQRRDPNSLTDSPLGPLASDSAQMLLVNLRCLLSLLFANYDCSQVTPSDFERCPDKHRVVATVNQSLAHVVERMHGGFLAEFWHVVQTAIEVAGCEVYAFRPTAGTFGPRDNALTSFHYFFADLRRGQILFIGSVTKSRRSVRGGADSDSDVALSGDSSVSSKDQSEASDNLREGEVAMFSDDSEGGMFD